MKIFGDLFETGADVRTECYVFLGQPQGRSQKVEEMNTRSSLLWGIGVLRWCRSSQLIDPFAVDMLRYPRQ
jgi:hypothetical protein